MRTITPYPCASRWTRWARWSSGAAWWLIVIAGALGSHHGSAATASAPTASAPAYTGPLQPAGTRSVVTHWPVLLSHPWGNDTTTSFRGDRVDAHGNYDVFGVKQMLEAEGVAVYQPDKVPFASHEDRGRLLNRKCAGVTLRQLLCDSGSGQVVDGLEHATVHYCSQPDKRARHGFATEGDCRKGLKFNLICHSQGCPDSRYMMVATTQAFSGLPLYRHIVSWTSLAGANKGTAQADLVLKLTSWCLTSACRSRVLATYSAWASWRSDRKLIFDGDESIRALTRHYMTVSTDMRCHPSAHRTCPPSFNERYRFPEDPAHPILYQSFSIRINDIQHPCHRQHAFIWRYLNSVEGPNDGNISVESQAFTTYGPNGQGGRTPVVARPFEGVTLDARKPHPGFYHMAFSDYVVPGINLGRGSCGSEDNSAFRFSRVQVYRDVLAELAERGY